MKPSRKVTVRTVIVLAILALVVAVASATPRQERPVLPPPPTATC